MGSNDDEDGHRDVIEARHYDVGYGKPPAASRFKKGKSGNPAGRPPKARVTRPGLPLVINDLIVAEAQRLLKITENDRDFRVPAQNVIARKVVAAAALGDRKAQLFVLGRLDAEAKRAANAAREYLAVMVAYKREKTAERKYAERKCKKWIPPIPHPDEIDIRLATGEVIFNGPKDECEAAQWGFMVEYRDSTVELIKELEQVREVVAEDPEEVEWINQWIENEKEWNNFITTWLPDEETRRKPGFNLHQWREMQPRYRKNLLWIKDVSLRVMRRRARIRRGLLPSL